MYRHTTRVSGLAVKERVCLFYNTLISTEEAFAFADEEITFDMMVRSGVRDVNCLACGLGPRSLCKRGACTAHALRKLGFDAVSLSESWFCSEAVLSYGSAQVTDAFLVHASDAVCIAGRESMRILGLSNTHLLSLCKGCPDEAREVLMASSRLKQSALQDVPPQVLLNTRMHASALEHAGYDVIAVRNATGAAPTQLLQLGFGRLTV